MKKGLAILLALVMAMGLCACGEEEAVGGITTTTTEAVTTTTQENDTTTEQGDDATTTDAAATTTAVTTKATTTEQGVGQITQVTTKAVTTTTAKPSTTTRPTTTTEATPPADLPPMVRPTTTTIPPRDPSLDAAVYQAGDTWVVDGKFELTLLSAQRGCFKPNQFVKQNEVEIGYSVKSYLAGDEYINLRAYDKYEYSGYDSEVYLTEPRTIIGDTHFFITSTGKYVWVRATYGDHEATFAIAATGTHE